MPPTFVFVFRGAEFEWLAITDSKLPLRDGVAVSGSRSTSTDTLKSSGSCSCCRVLCPALDIMSWRRRKLVVRSVTFESRVWRPREPAPPAPASSARSRSKDSNSNVQNRPRLPDSSHAAMKMTD
jgi:hypothetical protein